MLAASGVDLSGPAPSATAPPRPARPPSKPFTVLVVVASTGGPEALATVVRTLPAHLPVPVLVVQHMPAGFTEHLAERLDRLCPLRVRQAADGDVVTRGHVLVAPGGRHLEVHPGKAGLVARVTDGPQENFVRPAADVTLRTAVAGDGVLAAVLTGMGRDGTAGARLVRAAAGIVVAQDEPTSVVWGMPGTVVRTGLADDVPPLDRIGPDLAARLGGR